MRAGRGGTLAALLCVSLLAGGCASRDFYIRSLPAETPAADNAADIQQRQAMLAEAAAGASATPQADIGPPLTPEEAPSRYTYDPWERMNRFTYRFNARFDEAVFLPVADKYRRLPSPVRTGIHNFFANLGEVVSVLNYTAQLRPAPGVRSLGRFVINSTLGIGGLLDVATKMRISQPHTGFGATLARWGMQPGPYFVMPLLGPSTLRDGFRISRRLRHRLRHQSPRSLPWHCRLGTHTARCRRHPREYQLSLLLDGLAVRVRHGAVSVRT